MAHDPMLPDVQEQSLIQFLHRTPAGLIETDAQGRIELLNPMAAQLLLPLLPHPSLVNLFEVFVRRRPVGRGLDGGHPWASLTGSFCRGRGPLRLAAWRRA